MHKVNALTPVIHPTSQLQVTVSTGWYVLCFSSFYVLWSILALISEISGFSVITAGFEFGWLKYSTGSLVPPNNLRQNIVVDK